MSYSCSDFADTILEALKIECDDEMADSPSRQADACLAKLAIMATSIPADASIPILSVKTRFGDYVQAFSTKEKRNEAYRTLLLEWWTHDIGTDEPPPADLSELACAYFESPHRHDDNDAECDTITIDAPA